MKKEETPLSFFENFTHSVVATRMLLGKTHSQGNLIEGLILYASIIFEKLNDLYSFRNRIVHRFIISNVAYSDLESNLISYEYIYTDLMNKLEMIEGPSKLDADQEKIIKKNVLKKIKRDVNF